MVLEAETCFNGLKKLVRREKVKIPRIFYVSYMLRIKKRGNTRKKAGLRKPGYKKAF